MHVPGQYVFHKALSVPNLLDKSSEKSIHSQISTQFTQPPAIILRHTSGPLSANCGLALPKRRLIFPRSS